MSDYAGKEYVGLKILGILTAISGLFMLFGGIAYMSLGTAMQEAGEDSIIGIIALFPVGIAVVAMGAVMLVMGACFIYLGYKLYKHSKFAYWVTFILAGLGLVSSLVSLQIFGIILSFILCWYLYTIRAGFMSNSDYRRTTV